MNPRPVNHAFSFPRDVPLYQRQLGELEKARRSWGGLEEEGGDILGVLGLMASPLV
jgi:hypothetical protein